MSRPPTQADAAALVAVVVAVGVAVLTVGFLFVAVRAVIATAARFLL